MIASIQIHYIRTNHGPATLDLYSDRGGVGASAHVGMGPTCLARHAESQSVMLLQFDEERFAEMWIAANPQWTAERITA